MISYRNAITPTELGDFLIQAFHDFSVPVKNAVEKLRIFSKQFVYQSHQELDRLISDLAYKTRAGIGGTKNELNNLADRLRSNSGYYLSMRRENMRASQLKLINGSKFILANQKNNIQNIEQALPKVVAYEINKKRTNIEKMMQSIRLMDPNNVLKRGYSITTVNGKTISLENTVETGDEITTKTENFVLTSIVKSKNEHSS